MKEQDENRLPVSLPHFRNSTTFPAALIYFIYEILYMILPAKWSPLPKTPSFNKHNLSHSSFWNVVFSLIASQVSPATWWQHMSIAGAMSKFSGYLLKLQIQLTKLFLEIF